ncbi:MAG: addiction module protein [Spirochaetia bacterium]|jgi:putative addiction module component (TIGR02574 family)|nr:addiction module protein [Spirochaetia bacterium]
MESQEILKEVLSLKPQERFLIVEGILSSLDHPDKDIDEIWGNEAIARLQAYRAGKLKGFPISEIFND